MYKDTR